MTLTVTQSFVNIGLVFGVVAQRLERPPVTRKAAGSNPVNPATPAPPTHRRSSAQKGGKNGENKNLS